VNDALPSGIPVILTTSISFSPHRMEDTSNTSLATTFTPEEQAMLEKDRKGGSSLPTLPMLRLANKDATQAEEGTYFVETRKGKDEEPDIRSVGNNPEIVILYKTSTYTYFTPEDGLIAWTSDIHGFTSLDHVTLFVKKNGVVTIGFDGVWPEFKKFKEKYDIIDPVTERKKGSNLKFKSVLYVLFEGQPHKMFVSNASSAGVDSENKPSFDAPQPDSLQFFESQCWSGKHATYESRIELGSRLVKSTKPFYLMTFNVIGENENMKEAMHARIETEKAIFAIDDARRNAVTTAEMKTTSAPAQAFGEDVTPILESDLPF
jgi:hypothetical protein